MTLTAIIIAVAAILIDVAIIRACVRSGYCIGKLDGEYEAKKRNHL